MMGTPTPQMGSWGEKNIIRKENLAMTADKLIKNRLELPRLAEELGNVSQAC